MAHTFSAACNSFKSHVEQKLTLFYAAMAKSGHTKVVIASGESLLQFRDDLHLPYKINPYFVEWVPLLQHQGSYLVIEENKTPELHIHTPIDYWHSKSESLETHFSDPFALIEFSDKADISTTSRTAFIGENCPFPLDQQQINPTNLTNFIDYYRAYKTDYQIDCLRVANQRAVVGHKAAEAAFRRGESEYSIHMHYLLATGVQQHELPYDSIVALNQNASVLHHMQLSKERQSENRSFLIDAGVRYQGYGSDISRTYIAEQESELFSSLIKAVDDLQHKLVAEVKIGRPYTEIHDLSHRLVSETLANHGVVTCSAEQTYESGLSRVFLPHGVGHLIGVQVHDRGGHLSNSDGSVLPPPEHYPALRCTRIIEDNMVFTIEPGIYFIQSLLDSWSDQSLLNLPLINELSQYGGIRIEDNIVVRTQHNENLTRDAFAQVD